MKLNISKSQETLDDTTITEFSQKISPVAAPRASQEIEFMDESQNDGDDEDTLTSSKHRDAAPMKGPATRRSLRSPYHISNIIKRTAPPPPPLRSPTAKSIEEAHGRPHQVYDSHTSIETQYTSQASLGIGPPNAQSTPYTSDLTLEQQKRQAKANFLASPPMRQATTTRGVFDENGGVLEDKLWNVSLHIPPNALPKGVSQEIYFTVTDPRLSESVGGPPLDMENG